MQSTELSVRPDPLDDMIRRPASPSSPIQPQRFSTLVRVDFRKMIDIRSGKLLLGAGVGIAVAILVWQLFNTGSSEVSFENYSLSMMPSLVLFLPTIGLLAMTSEWTQRTALTTFTMSPRRSRVFGSKFVAALALAGVVLALILVLTLGATALGGVVSGEAASYEGMVDTVRSMVIITMLQVVMAAAFGALIPQTAVAMGAFLLAPNVWSVVSSNVLKDASEWFDIFGAYDRLSSSQPVDQLPQTLTAIAVWVALPAAVGLYRSVHREVK